MGIVEVEHEALRDGTELVTLGERRIRALVHAWDGRFLDLETDGLRARLAVTHAAGAWWVQDGPDETVLHELPRLPRRTVTRPAGSLLAPMNGVVVAVHVSAGDIVQAGDTLVVVEAMKMEHRVQATAVGRVDSVLVGAGQSVTAGDTMVVVHSDLDGAGAGEASG